jgi:hypothetical protein
MTGTVVISLDAELAWGYHDEESSASRPALRVDERLRGTYAALTRGHYAGHGITDAELDVARESWIRLLDVFDDFGVPATWAVVGHLFLNECDGEHRSHPLAPDWFANDPGGTVAEQPLWFAPDLIEAIAERPTDHEIGSHSFSHAEFGGTSREAASAELQATESTTDRSLTSLVFPRNRVGHLDALAEHGFTCYRGNMARWYDDSVVRPAVKAANMLAQRSPPPVSHPTVDEHGLVDVPASLNLFGFEGLARSLATTVVTDPLVRQAKLGIERAIAEEGVFHLWFHPNDVLKPSHIERVRAVLEHVAARRERGDITVATMSEVAERTLDD